MSPTLEGQTVFCPRCDEQVEIEEVKSWELRGGLGKQDFRVHLYKCGRCQKRFRRLERID